MAVATNFLERLSIEYPIVQAAMGGGIATPELVCAVSKAGGLGSLGISPISSFKKQIGEIKHEIAKCPYSVNLLMPFTTPEHIHTCVRERIPIVSIFYGFKKGLVKILKEAGCIVAYQVGTIEEARLVVADGADVLIAQGKEAGGHLRGSIPLNMLIPMLRKYFPKTAIVGAGGIHDAETVKMTMSLGADGVASGTRFLMSHESGAHPDYKKRLMDSSNTIVTTLFGMGWHAQHRVLVNKATIKWVNNQGEIPTIISLINKSVEPFSKHIPLSIQTKIHQLQSGRLPFYSPIVPHSQLLAPKIEYSALYAGQCVKHLANILPAELIVKCLARGITK